jgi:argininosuccinate synthase
LVDRPRIVLAFSGGLDTTFCAAWLRETEKADVITVTVDTGGFTDAERRRIEERSREAGAVRHATVDGRQRVWDRFCTYLVKGNCLRGGVYPLSVGAERIVQAEEVARVALEEGAAAVAHGSTGAGNDQVRFDTALLALAPGLRVLTPIRDLGWSRDQEADWLEKREIRVDRATRKYSVNAGLWGVTIGGGETHDPWKALPAEAWPTTADPEKAPAQAEETVLGFERGLPVSLDGKRRGPLDLLAALGTQAARHGVGRGVHLGDTILGIKGRIAFEAPAPAVILKAHRELEKLVLTKAQQSWKQAVAEYYGGALHEGLWFDPVMRDCEAFLDSSQERVNGDVRVRLYRGSCEVTGVRSPDSLLASSGAVYGEGAKAWTGAEAAGFSRLHGLQGVLAHRRPPAGNTPAGNTPTGRKGKGK